MTYGWAVLVVLVVIAALYYFGVFSPSKFTPDRCNFQIGISCMDYTVSSEEIDLSTAGLTIVPRQYTPHAYPLVFDLVNNMGRTMYVTKIAVSGDDLECMYLQYGKCPYDSVSFMGYAKDHLNLGANTMEVNFGRPCFSVVELCGPNDIFCDSMGILPAKELIKWGPGQTLKQGLGSLAEQYLAIPCTRIPEKGQKTDAVIKIEYTWNNPLLESYRLAPTNLVHSAYGELKTTVT